VAFALAILAAPLPLGYLVSVPLDTVLAWSPRAFLVVFSDFDEQGQRSVHLEPTARRIARQGVSRLFHAYAPGGLVDFAARRWTVFHTDVNTAATLILAPLLAPAFVEIDGRYVLFALGVLGVSGSRGCWCSAWRSLRGQALIAEEEGLEPTRRRRRAVLGP